jgi:hypothetical protein
VQFSLKAVTDAGHQAIRLDGKQVIGDAENRRRRSHCQRTAFTCNLQSIPIRKLYGRRGAGRDTGPCNGPRSPSLAEPQAVETGELTMTMSTAMSRRLLLELGAGAFAGTVLASDAASAQAQPGGTSKNEMIVRRWYRLWETEKKNWGPFDALLADDFTFTSAAPDDHISKTAFKKTCWDTQIAHIKSFDLELVMAKDNFVAVRWLCHTADGKAFRDVEVHRLRNLKIEALECYFGGPAGFPTAVESQKN